MYKMKRRSFLNRSTVLIGGLGLSSFSYAFTNEKKALWWITGLSGILLMGFVVELGGRIFSLPSLWVQGIHPFIARFHWPIRWDILLGLSLGLLAIRISRPWLWLAAIVIEMLFRSPNLPLSITIIESKKCLVELQERPGVWMEFPFVQENFPTMHQRIHQQPLINPLVLPPSFFVPKKWEDNRELHQLVHAIEEGKPFDVQTLKGLGIRGIYIPHTLPSLLPIERILQIKRSVRDSFGEGEHRSCMSFWDFSTMDRQ